LSEGVRVPCRRALDGEALRARRAGRSAGPDAVQVVILAPGAGLVLLRVVFDRHTVAGPVRALAGQAMPPLPADAFRIVGL